MNVLKPFDVGITSNEDAIRDLEDCVVVSDVDLEDIVTVNGIEVVRSDYDALKAVVPSYSFGKIVGESRILFSEKRVSILNLNIMALECLSGEIGRLTGLKELYLSTNSLSVLPVEIGSLVELRELDLSYNKLSVLPEEVGNLSELRKLNLYSNRFSDLHEELYNLPNLQYLVTGKNHINDYSVVNKLKKKGIKVYI